MCSQTVYEKKIVCAIKPLTKKIICVFKLNGYEKDNKCETAYEKYNMLSEAAYDVRSNRLCNCQLLITHGKQNIIPRHSGFGIINRNDIQVLYPLTLYITSNIYNYSIAVNTVYNYSLVTLNLCNINPCKLFITNADHFSSSS